ncbi:Os12g0103300, partial [Oryza sativa Japonica Group]
VDYSSSRLPVFHPNRHGSLLLPVPVLRRRRRRGRPPSTAGGSGGFSGGGGSNMLRFYTDEAPGLRLSPTMVLVMSLCFIGFVTALHVFGKLYRSRTAASASA